MVHEEEEEEDEDERDAPPELTYINTPRKVLTYNVKTLYYLSYIFNVYFISY